MHPYRKIELNPEKKAHIIQQRKQGFSDGTVNAQDAPDTVEQSHKRSQFLLKECGYTWPSIEDISKSVRSEWTIPAVKNRISELKKEHRRQLAKAIQYQEHEYKQVTLEEHAAFDTTGDWPVNVREDVKSILRMERHLEKHKSDDFIARLRYSHILELKPLYEKLQNLLLQEGIAKQQRARRFPKSPQAWRAMDTRDAKLKVAKFLLMDKQRQNEMILREPDWRADKIDIDIMVQDFAKNDLFAAEVKEFVKGSQTTDPRRRG